MQKKETRSMSFTLYKYELKVTKDLDVRPETLKLVQERAGNTEYPGINRHRQCLRKSNSNVSSTQRKDGQMGLHEIKKYLHNKRTSCEIEETVLRIGKKLLPGIHLTRD
jgi:hypothetical protein